MIVQDKNGYREATPEEEAKINEHKEEVKSQRDKDLDKIIVQAKTQGWLD